MKSLHMIDKAFLLKKTALFAPLEFDVLLSIAEKMELYSFEKGESLFKIGNEGKRMYFLLEGAIAIKNSESEQIAQLGAGECFGEESLLSEKPRGYEAIALETCHTLVLSRTHLLLILAEYSEVACRFLEAYASVVEFRKR